MIYFGSGAGDLPPPPHRSNKCRRYLLGTGSTRLIQILDQCRIEQRFFGILVEKKKYRWNDKLIVDTSYFWQKWRTNIEASVGIWPFSLRPLRKVKTLRPKRRKSRKQSFSTYRPRKPPKTCSIIRVKVFKQLMNPQSFNIFWNPEAVCRLQRQTINCCWEAEEKTLFRFSFDYASKMTATNRACKRYSEGPSAYEGTLSVSINSGYARWLV